jgi:hypothetical protein
MWKRAPGLPPAPGNGDFDTKGGARAPYRCAIKNKNKITTGNGESDSQVVHRGQLLLPL